MAEEQKRMNGDLAPNSLSVYLGRICETPGESFGENGILIVDLYDLDGSLNGPKYGEEGSTETAAIASWTLRANHIAWNNPPKIKYKGHLKLKGTIKMQQAQLKSATISAAPLNGTIMGSAGPIPVTGTSITPCNIQNGSGMVSVELQQNAELDVATEGNNLDIELTQQKCSQSPWCVTGKDFKEDDDVADDTSFIKAGDIAMCMAIGNSIDKLYVVDIFR